jgi:hypothetical protein
MGTGSNLFYPSTFGNCVGGCICSFGMNIGLIAFAPPIGLSAIAPSTGLSAFVLLAGGLTACAPPCFRWVG